ncbi:hypothetical protein ACO0LG_20110 [Undibacterium sp. Ji42W]|uniref:hypothetical protein n=1 Tax=Undibacterium sp. Ji42W TaxID=3413039 RepID=UPI003BF041DF
MGLIRSGSVIVFECTRLLELTLNILRLAKGAGWVSFEAGLTDQDQPLVLLESVTFNEAGLAWLEAVGSEHDCAYMVLRKLGDACIMTKSLALKMLEESQVTANSYYLQDLFFQASLFILVTPLSISARDLRSKTQEHAA